MDTYSVRCVFRWITDSDRVSKYLYEERITLWNASSFDAAIELAEQEAEVYAGEEMEFLGYSQAYVLSEPLPVSGVEVFSLLRDSDLEPAHYLDTFFDTGRERERSL